ncbi:MAG: four helix bundle protein [FCB group bacterium]|jgi:four helix bundle protein
MIIERFEDIIAWQKTKQLSVLIYKTFSNNKDYGFKDQLQRASVSVMNNIAEGFERKANKEFKQFLYVAKGSCGEVRSMLCLAKALGIIPDDKFKEFLKLAEEISKILGGFIKSL